MSKKPKKSTEGLVYELSEADVVFNEEVIKDNSISDLEKCSKFAEQYDNGDKVKPLTTNEIKPLSEDERRTLSHNIMAMS